MRVRHRRFSAQVLLWVIPVLLLSSCAAPGYNEREAMLFESRMTVEPKIGTFMPTNSNFTEGTVTGIRIDYEYDYNAHMGIEVSATRDVEIDNDSYLAGDLDPPHPFPPTSPGAFRALGELALSSSDRRSLVFTIDWDVPLSKDGSLPYLRYGLGLGALLTLNSLDPAVVAGYTGPETIDVTNQAMVLIRPSASLRWDLMDNTLALFAEAQVDITEHRLVFDFDLDGDKSPVVDFGGVNLLFGASYSF